PDVLTRLLSSTSSTPAQKREQLGLTLAMLKSTDAYSIPASQKPSIAVAAGAVVSSLLRDTSTTDEPRPNGTGAYQPSDTSLQKLLAGARELSTTLGAPVPIDV